MMYMVEPGSFRCDAYQGTISVFKFSEHLLYTP